MPKKAPEKIGSVLRVPLSQLHPHPQNPFAVRDDSAMQELKESVSQNGVLVPAIARPRAEGGYELIAGHRRKYACEQAGQDSMPVIVLNLNDDEAVIQLVDSNIQREDILPSERARAYKMKMANCFCRSGLDFSFAILRGISPHNYALYRAAVGLCTERRGVTLLEMADRELVDDDAFRLIINAMLIARYGIAAMKLKKEETSHDK